MENVRETLSVIGGLMHQQREAIVTATEDEILTIDREIERQIGEKERRMGALLQHRHEHGC